MADTLEDFRSLVARARQGDDSALNALVQQYEPEIRTVARYQLGPALRPYLDSVDLVQSVHRSLMAGLRQNKFEVADPRALVALALTMVRRKVVHHWRRVRRQQRVSGGSDDTPVPQVLAALSCSQTDPAEAAAFHDAVRHLWDHVDDTERRVLELRLQGHSTADIARALGLDADVLRVRLSRLRQRLRATGVLREWF